MRNERSRRGHRLHRHRLGRYGLAAIGPGIVFGMGVQAIARQPEAYNLIFRNMILGFAFAEALALIGLVMPFVYGID
jgi:F-type H+-transporting ATPase subunit c